LIEEVGYIEELIQTPELDDITELSREFEASFQSSNLIAQLQATVAGCGLCVLPLFMATQEKRLRRVLPETISLTRSFWLIVHSDMRDLARVRIVSDFITREVRLSRKAFIPEPR